MHKRVWLGGIAGVVGLAAVLLGGPAVIDWNRYKPEIIGRLETTLGRTVAIDGPLSLSLLPVPTFSAKGVRVANIDGASSPDMAELASLQARLRLLPLLSGHVEMSALVLVAPVIRLETLADGRPNWRFTPNTSAIVGTLSPTPGNIEGSSVRGLRAPPIDTLSVERGSLVWQRPGTAPLRLDAIEGSFFLTDEGRAFRGTGRAAGGGSGFSFDLAAPSAADAAGPASLAIQFDQAAGELRLNGQLAGSGEERRLRGKLTVKAAEAGRLAGVLGAPSAVAWLPAGALRLDGSVALSPRDAELEGLTLALGDVRATGAASFGWSGGTTAELSLRFGRIDIDALLSDHLAPPAPAPAAAPVAAPAVAPGPAETAPPAAGRAMAVALPKGLSANLDLSADVVKYRGGLLRGARFNAALANGEITINQAGIGLPGDGQVNLFGFIVAEGGRPSFDGAIEAGTDDLRSLLDWLKLDVAAVPADRLHGARLASQVKATPDEMAFEGTRLQVDAMRLDAAATLRFGPRPALGGSFAVDSVNADAYWPKPRTEAATPAVSPSAAGPSAAVVPAGSAAAGVGHWLDGIDANLRGRVGQITARGLTAKDVAFDGSWVNARLALRELSVADLSGTQIRLAGEVGGLTGGPLGLHDLHYELHSGEPGRLPRQLGLVLPVDPDRLGTVALSGTIDGDLDQLTIDTRSEVAGGQLNLAGKVSAPATAPRFEGTLEASHASVTQLVRLFAPSYHPTGTLGPFAASGKLKGDANLVEIGDLRLRAGPLTLTGETRLALAGRPRLDAKLTAGEVPIDAFLSGGRQADAQPTLQQAPGRRAALWHGVPQDGPSQAVPRPLVKVSTIPERWSRQPLDLSWLAGFDAGLQLEARALTFRGTRFEAASFAVSLANGAASLDRFAGTLYGGKVAAVGKVDTSGSVQLQLGLAHAQMREALLGVADLDIADGLLDAEASLATSGGSQAEMIGRLSGSGKFAVQDGLIRGFDLKASNDRLQHPDPASLLTVLQSGLSGGNTRFSSLTGSVRAANGILSTDDLRLVADGGGATGTAQLNLPASIIDAQVNFQLATAGAPPLVMHLSGPLEAPRRVVDINALQGWLAQRFVAKRLKDATKSGEAAPPDGKVKPKDLLKGLIKDFGH